jgi:hypothetical protein
VGLEDPATPVDPAGRVTVVDPGDMNRVAAATVGTAAAMAPADLASRAVPVDPVVRVGMTPADPVGMIPVAPEVRLRAPNPAVLVAPEVRLRAPSPVLRVEPGNREATDLSLGQALLGPMPMRRVPTPMRRHPTAAGPVPMRALLHLTPADRRRDPTTRAVATCQAATRAVATCPEATPAVAIRAEATRAVAIRRAEATRRAEASDGGAELSRRPD